MTDRARPPFKERVEPSYPIDIFVAGDRADARRICREHCMAVGLCVHIVDADYVYTGGQESGVKVGLIHYPRFPQPREELWDRAVTLAHILIEGLCQSSATVQGPDRTLWLSRRAEPPTLPPAPPLQASATASTSVMDNDRGAI